MTTPAPAAARWRVTLVVGLTLIAAAALLLRIPSIAEPLGIDQSLWASAARGMARGQRLYHDVWEQRPPGIYWTYVAGFHLLGWHASTVAWLDILASAATTILLFAIAGRLNGPVAGSLAAALYAALTMPAWLYGHDGFLERSVCETFIAVCVAFSAWCAVQVREHDSMAAAAGLGLAAGAAVIFKPNAGLYFPALLLWLYLYRRASSARPAYAAIVVVAIAASAIVPIAAFAWLWRLHLLHDAKVAVIDFNRYYVGKGFSPGAYAVEVSKAIWLRIKTQPLWFAGSVGAAIAVVELGRRRTLAPLAGLAALWGAAAALMMAVNGARLFNSYFMNPLPPLALMAAWMFAAWAPAFRSRRWMASATGAVMLAVLVRHGYATRVIESTRLNVDALRGAMSRDAYLDHFGGYGNDGGYSARANAQLADYVRAHTNYDDRIFLFGISGAGVYFSSDRLTAQRFLRVNFFVDSDFGDPEFRLPAVIDELADAAPAYLIFERLPLTSPMAQVANELVDARQLKPLLLKYAFETRIEDFTLYRRRH